VKGGISLSSPDQLPKFLHDVVATMAELVITPENLRGLRLDEIEEVEDTAKVTEVNGGSFILVLTLEFEPPAVQS
jgi:hypothetical protein